MLQLKKYGSVIHVYSQNLIQDMPEEGAYPASTASKNRDPDILPGMFDARE